MTRSVYWHMEFFRSAKFFQQKAHLRSTLVPHCCRLDFATKIGTSPRCLTSFRTVRVDGTCSVNCWLDLNESWQSPRSPKYFDMEWKTKRPLIISLEMIFSSKKPSKWILVQSGRWTFTKCRWQEAQLNLLLGSPSYFGLCCFKLCRQHVVAWPSEELGNGHDVQVITLES